MRRMAAEGLSPPSRELQAATQSKGARAGWCFCLTTTAQVGPSSHTRTLASWQRGVVQHTGSTASPPATHLPGSLCAAVGAAAAPRAVLGAAAEGAAAPSSTCCCCVAGAMPAAVSSPAGCSASWLQRARKGVGPL